MQKQPGIAFCNPGQDIIAFGGELVSAVFFGLGTLFGSHLLPELFAILFGPLAGGVDGEGGRHQLIGPDTVASYAGAVGVECGETVARGSMFTVLALADEVSF